MKYMFAWQCVLVGLLAVAIDLVGAWHIKALVAGRAPAAVGTIVTAHYLAYCGTAWFVDYKQTYQRLWLTTAWGVGAGLGTYLAMEWL